MKLGKLEYSSLQDLMAVPEESLKIMLWSKICDEMIFSSSFL